MLGNMKGFIDAIDNLKKEKKYRSKWKKKNQDLCIFHSKHVTTKYLKMRKKGLELWYAYKG